MARRGADDVRRNDQPRAVHDTGLDRVAQVDGRELRIHAAQVAQRREAMAHVLASDREAGQRLRRRGPQRLDREVSGVHREMDMGVDEPRADGALGKVHHLGVVRPRHRGADLGDAAVADKDLRRPGELVADPVEGRAADQHGRAHAPVPSRPFSAAAVIVWTPVDSVGSMTGANFGLWLVGTSSATRPACSARW